MGGSRAQEQAFLDALPENIARLVLIAGGTLLILLCLRLAYLRARAPRGDRLRDSSPFALLSYAAYAAIPTIEGYLRFGAPLTPWKFTLYLLAMSAGFVAAFSQITVRVWFGRGRPPAREEDEENR